MVVVSVSVIRAVELSQESLAAERERERELSLCVCVCVHVCVCVYVCAFVRAHICTWSC